MNETESNDVDKTHPLRVAGGHVERKHSSRRLACKVAEHNREERA